METLLLQRYNTEIAIAQYDNVTNRCCDQDMRAGRRNREGQGSQGSLRLKPGQLSVPVLEAKLYFRN